MLQGDGFRDEAATLLGTWGSITALGLSESTHALLAQAVRTNDQALRAYAALLGRSSEAIEAGHLELLSLLDTNIQKVHQVIGRVVKARRLRARDIVELSHVVDDLRRVLGDEALVREA